MLTEMTDDVPACRPGPHWANDYTAHLFWRQNQPDQTMTDDGGTDTGMYTDTVSEVFSTNWSWDLFGNPRAMKTPKKSPKNFQKFSRTLRDSSDLWETTLSRTCPFSFLHKKSTYRISWGRSKMHSCNISTLKYIFTWKQHSVKFTLDGLKCPIILLFCKTLGSFRKESFRFLHKNKMDNNSWRFTALQMSLSFGISGCFWLALSRCSLNVFVAFFVTHLQYVTYRAVSVWTTKNFLSSFLWHFDVIFGHGQFGSRYE